MVLLWEQEDDSKMRWDQEEVTNHDWLESETEKQAQTKTWSVAQLQWDASLLGWISFMSSYGYSPDKTLKCFQKALDSAWQQKRRVHLPLFSFRSSQKPPPPSDSLQREGDIEFISNPSTMPCRFPPTPSWAIKLHLTRGHCLLLCYFTQLRMYYHYLCSHPQ